MRSVIRWNITVSPNTDQSVRMFLTSHGDGREGDLSRFIMSALYNKASDFSQGLFALPWLPGGGGVVKKRVKPPASARGD